MSTAGRSFPRASAASIALVVLALAAPSSSSTPRAEAFVAHWYLNKRDHFSGRQCGSVDKVRITLTRRAFHIRPVRPRVGTTLFNFNFNAVAEIVGRGWKRLPGGRKVAQWRAKGAGDVCERPERYPNGWLTRNRGFRVNFDTREKVYFYDTRDRRLRKPEIVYFGAHERIFKLRWRSWDGKRARARGIYPVNDCRPNCAEGHITNYPVRVKLSKVRQCGSRFRYLRIRWTFRAGPYSGRSSGTNFRYLC